MSHSFTPGPWEADGNVIRSKFGGQICMFSPWIRQTADQLEDNARLIAAAPDLLEALVLLEAEMVASGNAHAKDFGWKPAIEKTRAAIAKATGEQP